MRIVKPEISGYRGTGGIPDFRFSLGKRTREERKRKRRGRSPVFLPDSVNAKRKDPRHLSDRLSLFCRSASGYSPHVVLGQEVRLRSGRNLSRGATLSPVSFPPFLSARFYFVPPWRWVESKRVSPGRRSKRVRFCPVYSVRSKGVGRWKVGGGGGGGGGGRDAGESKGDRCLLHTAPGGGVLIRRRRRSSGR